MNFLATGLSYVVTAPNMIVKNGVVSRFEKTCFYGVKVNVVNDLNNENLHQKYASCSVTFMFTFFFFETLAFLENFERE